MTGLKDAAAIVGIGETEFSKHLEPTEKALACQAILAALDDAGIDPGEVDGLSSYTMEQTTEVDIVRSIGAREISFFSQVGYGGGAGPGLGRGGNVGTGDGCAVGTNSRESESGQYPHSYFVP